MATTYYASVGPGVNTGNLYDLDSGTSSTSADIIELRMGNGTYVPTQREVLEALVLFQRWLIQRGTDGLGTNLPPSSG